MNSPFCPHIMSFIMFHCKDLKAMMAHTHLGDSWKVSEGASVLPLPAFQRHLEVRQLELDSAQVQGDNIKVCNIISG